MQKKKILVQKLKFDKVRDVKKTTTEKITRC
jgi:hypothetical protein